MTMLKIKLKNSSHSEKINELLKNKYELPNIGFLTQKENQDWLDDINKNPKSPQAHLKPEERNLTMQELKSIFKAWTEEGVLEYDFKYDRGNADDISKLSNFIKENSDKIDYLKNADELIKRFEKAVGESKNVLLNLNKQDEPPKKLPVKDRRIPNLQSGIMLCKSWGIKPFWVIFGRVERPTFLKEKIYVEDVYNNLYRDKNGYAYMLLPLNDFSEGFIENVINEAQELGMREHPNYFAATVYSYHIGIDIKTFADIFAEAYTTNELLERLKFHFQKLRALYNYENDKHIKLSLPKFKFNPFANKNYFTSYNNGLQEQLNLLNALFLAITKNANKWTGVDLIRELENEKIIV